MGLRRDQLTEYEYLHVTVAGTRVALQGRGRRTWEGLRGGTYEAELLHEGVHAGRQESQVLPADQHARRPHQHRQRLVRMLPPQLQLPPQAPKSLTRVALTRRLVPPVLGCQ